MKRFVMALLLLVALMGCSVNDREVHQVEVLDVQSKHYRDGTIYYSTELDHLTGEIVRDVTRIPPPPVGTIYNRPVWVPRLK